jgi:flagellar L-ring protein precursor FlgH
MSAPGAPQQQVPPAAAERLSLASLTMPDDRDPATAGSLWHSGPTSLFGDRRARTLGDILTVIIEIDDEAEIKNRTDRTRDATEGLSVPNFFGLPSLASDVLPNGATLAPAIDATSSSTANGDGNIKREEKVTLRVAATVARMLPNGHMVITGSQEVRVNHELRDLQVAGIIRPEDISRRNTITYEKIADARIMYGGRGVISDVQQPRYGQKILDAILPY